MEKSSKRRKTLEKETEREKKKVTKRTGNDEAQNGM